MNFKTSFMKLPPFKRVSKPEEKYCKGHDQKLPIYKFPKAGGNLCKYCDSQKNNQANAERKKEKELYSAF